MKTYLSTLIVGFLAFSSNSGADTIDYNAAIAASSYNYGGNRIKLPSVEAFLGVGYWFDNVRLHSIVVATNTETRLESAAVSYNYDLVGSEIETSVGRIVHKTSSLGSRRLNPSTRGSIVLPQSINWFNAAASLALGDGITTKWTSNSGSYLRLSREKTNVRDAAFVREVLSLPGVVVGSYGSTAEAVFVIGNFALGYEDRTWGFNSSIAGSQFLNARTVFSSYDNAKHSISGQYALVEDSYTMRSLGQDISNAYSVLYTYRYTDDVSVTFNRNVINFNSKLLALYNPSKNRAEDNNLGVQYREYATPITYRVEYHNIVGTGWLSSADNVGGLKPRTKIVALQVVYELR